MILDFLFIIIGIALVLWGADKFTDGASALARRMHVPPIVIGLTVVAMGTSATSSTHWPLWAAPHS